MSDDLLSVKQAADELGVSPEAVYQLGKRGRLPIRQVGSLRLVTRADLDIYKASIMGKHRPGPKRARPAGEQP